MFRGMNISASALTAQRLRMDIVSSNIANAETTRARFVNGEAVPYTRKIPIVQSEKTFNIALKNAMHAKVGNGVKVTRIVEDQAPYRLVYDPNHPDAVRNPESPEFGYVRMPNVDIAVEMVDLISSSRSYEANITAINAAKNMAMKALEIGRR